MTTNTNIKNLPEGEYFTEFGYSQSYPWRVLKKTPKTITLVAVEVERDPDWKPEFTPGGFCAHCNNQQDQTWLYKETDPTRTKVIRQTKKGWASKGVRFGQDQADYFYDYNF